MAMQQHQEQLSSGFQKPQNYNYPIQSKSEENFYKYAGGGSSSKPGVYEQQQGNFVRNRHENSASYSNLPQQSNRAPDSHMRNLEDQFAKQYLGNSDPNGPTFVNMAPPNHAELSHGQNQYLNQQVPSIISNMG